MKKRFHPSAPLSNSKLPPQRWRIRPLADKTQNLKLSEQGFVLIELLTAILLFSIAGSLLAVSLTQGLKAKARIQKSSKSMIPIKLALIQLEKDLRNSVSLKDYPFHGEKEELLFPSSFTQDSKEGKDEKKLYLIRYYLKNHSLMRSRESLTQDLQKEKHEKPLLKNIRSLTIEYLYEDHDQNRSYESFWLTEPYFGIPRGVRISFSTPDMNIQKMISIPQGRFGHMNQESFEF